MNKSYARLIVLILIVLFILIIDVDTSNRLSEIQLLNEQLNAIVDDSRAELEHIEYEIILSKIELNKQAFMMNKKHFEFMIENKDLIMGVGE